MSQPVQEQATVEKRMGPFFLMWGGQAVSLLGSQLVQFALVWYLTESTGSATVLAFSTMMALLPQVFLSPFAGALVDRWHRRTVMIVADSVVALTTVGLVALFATDLIQIWHIYAAMLVRGAGGAFHWPAMQASTTLMVPEKHLSRVAGLNQALWGGANIVSPPLGALLLGVLQMHNVLSIDVITAIVAIAPLFFIHVPQPQRAAASGTGVASVLADLRDGLRFVWGWPGLMMIIGVATLINLMVTPAFSLLPLMVTGHFGGGALELATLQSAEGIGMIAGGIILGAWGGFRKRILTAMLALILLGSSLAVVGLVPGSLLMVAAGALLFGGIMSPIVNGSLHAVMQSTVPPEMQGRVFTLLISGATAMTPIGLAVAGPLGDAFGVPIWFVIGGTFTAAMGVAALFISPIMNIEERQMPGTVSDTVSGAVGGAEVADPVPAD